GLTFLLYKPVLKFINKRQESIKSQLDANEETKLEAEKLFKEYKAKLDQAETEIDRKKVEADKSIAFHKESVMQDAKKRADEIYRKAEIESENERIEAINNLHNEVADVALNIASNILEREISKEENAKIIDACINEWSDTDND
ncbi:MAG TPA: ATP synthase F0 subunit B, partial [Clostridia bacterium]|nr:ATP synthase F0 subunit B [Clostridia bacterium]